MPLGYYYDLMSQPCRAVYIFLKAANIPFESKVLAIRKSEHKEREYLKINPLGKVPAINDNGFHLTESVAILKYLSEKYASNDSWYPRNLQIRAKIDEYCAWQHLNTRMKSAKLFFMDVILSRPKEELDNLASDMDTMLDELETMFLKNQMFLAGEKVTIADLLAVCEISQVSTTGRDMLSGRPVLQAWMERVRSATNPYFDEAHVFVYRLRDKRSKSKL